MPACLAARPGALIERINSTEKIGRERESVRLGGKERVLGRVDGVASLLAVIGGSLSSDRDASPVCFIYEALVLGERKRGRGLFCCFPCMECAEFLFLPIIIWRRVLGRFFIGTNAVI